MEEAVSLWRPQKGKADSVVKMATVQTFFQVFNYEMQDCTAKDSDHYQLRIICIKTIEILQALK